MAAGYQATVQSWRASYITLGIFSAILFVLFIFFYEETKYVKVIDGLGSDDTPSSPEQLDTKTLEVQTNKPHFSNSVSNGDESNNNKTEGVENPEPAAPDTTTVHHEIDYSIPMNSWKKRLALFTPSSESIWPYYYRPWIILLSFPHVMFTSLQYATGVIWLSIMSSVMSIVFSMPPYKFNPAQIGYMSTGPFVGSIIGAAYGGFLGDRTILFFSKRNKGYYEPEMRLYILLFPALFLCAGLLMFGISTSRVRLLPRIMLYMMVM